MCGAPRHHTRARRHSLLSRCSSTVLRSVSLGFSQLTNTWLQEQHRSVTVSNKQVCMKECVYLCVPVCVCYCRGWALAQIELSLAQVYLKPPHLTSSQQTCQFKRRLLLLTNERKSHPQQVLIKRKLTFNIIASFHRWRLS